jgi:hypothetical protein
MLRPTDPLRFDRRTAALRAQSTVGGKDHMSSPRNIPLAAEPAPACAEVYHASDTAGIGSFLPRAYWRRGAESGRCGQDSTAPPDAEVVWRVYAAAQVDVPFYFVPRRCPRLCVPMRKQRRSDAFRQLARHFGAPPSTHTLVLSANDRALLRQDVFYVYSFASGHFRPTPTGEFYSDRTVMPRSSAKHTGSLDSILNAGWTVLFAADLTRTLWSLIDMGLVVDSQGI